MGATSVTGVSGIGDVSGQQKGSEHMSLGVSKLVGPRVVQAGTVTLSGGAGVVYFPNIVDTATNYLAMATNTSAAAAVAVTSMTISSSTGGSLTLAGTGSNVINWMIVKSH